MRVCCPLGCNIDSHSDDYISQDLKFDYSGDADICLWLWPVLVRNVSVSDVVRGSNR